VNEKLLTLQLRYANAIYQVERYSQEAQAALVEMTAMATAEAQIANPPVESSRCAPVSGVSVYGLYTAVAKNLGLSPAHVRNVDRGLRSSARVMQELNKEKQRRQRLALSRERAA
jgi:predicted naringenin-chalcone synthase